MSPLEGQEVRLTLLVLSLEPMGSSTKGLCVGSVILSSFPPLLHSPFCGLLCSPTFLRGRADGTYWPRLHTVSLHSQNKGFEGRKGDRKGNVAPIFKSCPSRCWKESVPRRPLTTDFNHRRQALLCYSSEGCKSPSVTVAAAGHAPSLTLFRFTGHWT